ncbi:MAG: ABC transporter ATP-binding protein [Burkholderiaceae bacterium]|nr:ABC transporter ATP-binding protein [Burkholderiaceae bacterium]MBT9501140.1 ABC transporter ATP-binding protein [Burkholderiaceae bacterium]
MIEFQQIGLSLGGKPVIAEVSLRIAPGEFAVLIGPSGAGKSSLLRMVNRLLEPDRGQVLVGGVPVRELEPTALRRRIGYVIQSTGLFPHRTVAQNMATVPGLLQWPVARIAARTAELMALLHLDKALAERYPHQLSGGQQQRVGVARALAADPEILLMDEPFAALDAVTRRALQAELLQIQRSTGKTVLMVTHDLDEALRLGTRIHLLDGGRLLQSGTPLELMTRPASPEVSAFLGLTLGDPPGREP